MSGGHIPTPVVTAPRAWKLSPGGHLTFQCMETLDGGPACPACLAYRLRAYEREDRR